MNERSRAKHTLSGRQHSAATGADAAAMHLMSPPPATSAFSAPPGGVDPQMALRAARSDCTVLISGETGVGKGYLARWMHAQSSRGSRQFIPVNCGAIPEGLIDSHLFGHARGAFTGAADGHIGMVRAADGGTLLLDEISEMPPSAQLRLLRLLQEREVQPVGYSKPMTVDVRVIAATNIDLYEAMHAGNFREDLLYRLDVVTLRMSPLRERPETIEPLLNLFNREFAATYRREPLLFTPEALAVIRRHRWPGNVRQVRTLLERLHVLCTTQEVSVAELRQYGSVADPDWRAKPARAEEIRLKHARQVLREVDGSYREAADALGVHRSTLYRWLRDESSDGA